MSFRYTIKNVCICLFLVMKLCVGLDSSQPSIFSYCVFFFCRSLKAKNDAKAGRNRSYEKVNNLEFRSLISSGILRKYDAAGILFSSLRTPSPPTCRRLLKHVVYLLLPPSLRKRLGFTVHVRPEVTCDKMKQAIAKTAFYLFP